jgi:hypothetical protein
MSAILQFLHWWYTPLDDFIRTDVVVGSLIFILFIVIISFVLVNMFVGFSHKGYKEANKELVYKREGRDKRGRKVNYFISVHAINRIRDVLYRTLGTVNKDYKEKY